MFLLTYYLLKLLFILIDCFYLHFWNASHYFSLDFFFLFPNFFIQFPICLFVFAVVQLVTHVWLFVTPWTANARLPSLSPSLGLGSNSCPLNWWCLLYLFLYNSVYVAFSILCLLFASLLSSISIIWICFPAKSIILRIEVKCLK